MMIVLMIRPLPLLLKPVSKSEAATVTVTINSKLIMIHEGEMISR